MGLRPRARFARAWSSASFTNWGYGGWEKSSSLSVLFRCPHSCATRFLLGLVLYSILFPYFHFSFFSISFFWGGKTMFSFQTLNCQSLTWHLQLSITATVSMTLKRKSVQSLSDHKTARTFCVSQERANGRTNCPEKNNWSFALVWSRGREGKWDWGEKRKYVLKIR